MIADVQKSADQKMQKTLETLKNDLGMVRTGRALVDEVQTLGQREGVPVTPRVLTRRGQEAAILRQAERGGHNLMVLGVQARPSGERLFFGDAKCATCHEVNGRGLPLAADLSEIGKRSPGNIKVGIDHQISWRRFFLGLRAVLREGGIEVVGPDREPRHHAQQAAVGHLGEPARDVDTIELHRDALAYLPGRRGDLHQRVAATDEIGSVRQCPDVELPGPVVVGERDDGKTTQQRRKGAREDRHVLLPRCMWT